MAQEVIDAGVGESVVQRISLDQELHLNETSLLILIHWMSCSILGENVFNYKFPKGMSLTQYPHLSITRSLSEILTYSNHWFPSDGAAI